MSGPFAESARPVLVTHAGGRLYLGHDVLLWPLTVDVGVGESSGQAWCLLACGQTGCGATLLEIEQHQVIDNDWPTDLDSLKALVYDHAPQCAAFGIVPE